VASDGSRGPKPFTQVRQSTVFLRVPTTDWPLVKRGIKREFRSNTGRNKTPKLWHVEPPMPVVAYVVDQQGRHDARLMVLEDMRSEPLGAISPESLELEGFASLAEFRRYWMKREGRRFQPTRPVYVYRLRPWESGDAELMGRRLLERLYGDFVPQEVPA